MSRAFRPLWWLENIKTWALRQAVFYRSPQTVEHVTYQQLSCAKTVQAVFAEELAMQCPVVVGHQTVEILDVTVVRVYSVSYMKQVHKFVESFFSHLQWVHFILLA